MRKDNPSVIPSIAALCLLYALTLTACSEQTPNLKGTTWTAVNTGVFGKSAILAIAWGDNKFVAVGRDGKMAYSTDGVTWTAANTGAFGTSSVYAIAYGGNKFVAGGIDRKMSYSSDDITWTAIMAYSTDGVTWKAILNTTFGLSGVYAIAWGDNKFIAGSDNGKMAYSSNGVIWTAISDTAFGNTNSETINTIAYGGDHR